MSERIHDVVIIGAGPAGSAAAILLARVGWSVVLVEKEPFPRRKVCGECVAASNLPLLRALGVGDAFEAAAGPSLRKVALMNGVRTIVADMPSSAAGTPHWGRALGREKLDVLLLQQARAAGAEILQPCRLDAIEGRAGDWRCRIRDPDTQHSSSLRARIAIDAHGSWQSLPSIHTQPRRTTSGSDLLAFKANFSAANLADGLLPVLAFDGGYGGMVVAEEGITTVACCIRHDRLNACRLESPHDRAGDVVEAYLQAQCDGVRAALGTAKRIGPWLASGPLDPGIRIDTGDDPFRIGNAAGEAHPIIGEGMSMALQSAWLLAEELLAQGKPSAFGRDVQRDVARRYAARWRAAFEPRLLFAAGFAALAMRPLTTLPLIRLAQAWPGILTLGARIKRPLPRRPSMAAVSIHR